MSKVKEFLYDKSKGWYLFAISAISALLMLIVYVARGGDVLTKLEPWAIGVLAVGVIINLVLCLKNVQPLEIIPFILYFVGLAIFFATEIDFIGNIIYGVDGNTLDFAFVLVALFGAVATVLGMIACIIKVAND